MYESLYRGTKTEMWSVGFVRSTGYPASQLSVPLLEWVYDHWQHYSGNSISTRIQSLSIILKPWLPLFKTTSAEEFSSVSVTTKM